MPSETSEFQKCRRAPKSNSPTGDFNYDCRILFARSPRPVKYFCKLVVGY